MATGIEEENKRVQLHVHTNRSTVLLAQGLVFEKIIRNCICFFYAGKAQRLHFKYLFFHFEANPNNLKLDCGNNTCLIGTGDNCQILS